MNQQDIQKKLLETATKVAEAAKSGKDNVEINSVKHVIEGETFYLKTILVRGK